ncbi:aspartyl-tRNA(Asn)/glutamyl-tRNA(Gln) amidotransferase subunit A [Crossiella equi]|uniref:Aspartyl-tRNA(Asn)/glutamyl-tRNA(Gln) amidotransferase subunit A n=1 Tax=Crossiella equi TaxID=130796 RepID=A0ABS5A9L0_9PSEU|nr:amidase [Crossiella equi]MBP2473263.1 aspartyl-tRNA(Asn)/glutamyl-tRNA(Gln) amidotransferase subunit A [Crossiella equi]
MTTDLADLTAVALVAGYRAGQLSPVEVTEAVLARVGAWEPELHALYAPDPTAALAQARASEQRWREGAPLGPVDGVPVTVKENIATEGTPVPLGTAATPLTPAPVDAPPAARLRESGAVLIAKTTMPDFGMLTSGLSSFHPLTRNPWRLDRNPGGSSAGAAAAAAAGYGPLHVGTDIGGSIRLPAGLCGLVGHKPSFGRVPVDPPFLGRVAGPLTRTVEDAALLMSVLSQPDARDYWSLPPAEIPWLDLDVDLTGVRIGLHLDAGAGLPVEPAVTAAVTEAAAAFEAAGAVLTPVEPFLSQEVVDGLDRFWRTRFRADLAGLPEDRIALILPYIRDWVFGGEEVRDVDVYRGFARMDQMSAAAGRVFGEVEFVLSPVCPVVSFAAGAASPVDDPARPFGHIGFTVPYNMSGQPSTSVNCGYADGLPIGLQITGRRFDDLGVLRLAKAYESLRPEQLPWPVAP